MDARERHRSRAPSFPRRRRSHAAPHGWIADEDDRAVRRVDLLVVDREPRVPGDHDVRPPDGPASSSVCDSTTWSPARDRAVRVDPEGIDPERLAQGLPEDRRPRESARSPRRSATEYALSPSADRSTSRTPRSLHSIEGLRPPSGCLQLGEGEGSVAAAARYAGRPRNGQSEGDARDHSLRSPPSNARIGCRTDSGISTGSRVT